MLRQLRQRFAAVTAAAPRAYWYVWWGTLINRLGGFVVPLAYAWAKSHYGSIEPALWFYVGFFVLLLALTWFAYLRPNTRMARAGV